MELNDLGEYNPVEMQGKQDVMTGGIFMIKQVCFKKELSRGNTSMHISSLSLWLQGQSRRVRVTVTSVTPASQLKMDCITSIAIGSIYFRNRLDDSLDSYQEQDLERWGMRAYRLPCG